MSATDAAIGMMDGAYFVSRNEILSFFNNLLDLNLKKIEETASGAVACQVTEYIFPGSIPMSKVNWGAKASHEYVANYKLLQNAFKKHKIQRYVDVDKLIRGKYQDNLEFCQWLKAFFNQTASMMSGRREGYDPAAVRARGKGGKAIAKGGGGSRTVVRSTAASRTTGGRTASSRPPARALAQQSNSSKENTANESRRTVVNQSWNKPSQSAAKYEEETRKLKSQLDDLQTKHSALERASAETEMNYQTVEGERDFYFEKLRGIEVMLQVYREKEQERAGSGEVNCVMDRIFKVMYASMDDNVVVDDEGNLPGETGAIESSVSVDEIAFTKTQDAPVEVDEEELLVSDGGSPSAAVERAGTGRVPAAGNADDDELLTDGPLDARERRGAGRADGVKGDGLGEALPPWFDDDISDCDLLADEADEY